MWRLLRLWRMGGRDLRLLWFALRHAQRPFWQWPIALGLLFFALEPFNFAVPLLGMVDDFFVLPLMVHAFVRLLPVKIRDDYAISG